MSEAFFLNFIHLYLKKKHSLNHQISKISTDYARLKRKQTRALFFRNMFIYQLKCLIDQSIMKYHRTTLAYSKSGSWWLHIVPQMNDKQFNDNFGIQRSTFKKILEQVEGGVAEFSQAEFKNSVIISLYCFAIKILLRILFSQQNFVRILISQQNFVSLSTPILVS